MNARKLKLVRHARRKSRVRSTVFGTSERPRLAVFRSHKHIYAQLIDDMAGQTLCAAGTTSKALSGELKNGGNCAAAARVGQLLAEQARMKGVRRAAFDRAGYRYHGRVKALAEAARKTGLEF
jgi:large subunit ribosomal protein L18